ncbi:MAG: hypothetical protein F7B17_01910 [Desulfurococcales archaeon]|nr:hypothetical protein [Desulfurococcales archaeon]
MAVSYADKLRILASAILYYIIIYLYIYLGSILALKLGPPLISNPVFTFIYIVAAIILFLLTAYIIHRYVGVCSEAGFIRCLGLTTNGFLESLVFSSAIITLAAVVLGIASYILNGTNPFNEAVKATIRYAYYSSPEWFNSVPLRLLPVVSLLVWFLAGIMWFTFIQAFPLNLLSRSFGPSSIPLVSLSFILLYGAPLLTGNIKLDDILFLGITYTLILYKYNNSLGLITCYVLLYEMPVRASFLVGWGLNALKVVILLQLSWGITSIVFSLYIIINNIIHAGRDLENREGN